jgi:glucoamylase
MYESLNRMKDGSVVHAFSSFGVYPITSYKVADTMRVLSEVFCLEFTINQVQSNDGLAGILIGRYPGDIYAGGNPWQLLSAVYAKTFYQMANSIINSNGFSNSRDKEAWFKLLKISSHSSLRAQAQAAINAGDSVLYRIYQNVKNDGGHISEQMDRVTGTQMSAKDLTWSYANILSAMQERNKATSNLA